MGTKHANRTEPNQTNPNRLRSEWQNNKLIPLLAFSMNEKK